MQRFLDLVIIESPKKRPLSHPCRGKYGESGRTTGSNGIDVAISQ